MSDPNLKDAMKEIMDVLNKHDIAGQVTLVSKTHAEFRLRIDPSWSVAKLVPLKEGYGIRFRVKKQDIPDKQLRLELAALTLHILAQIRDLNAQNFMAFDNALKQLSEVIDFEHHPGSGFEPHKTHKT